MPAYDAKIAEIIGLYRPMRYMQEQRKRNDLAFQAYVRTIICGYSTHDPKEVSTPALERARGLIDGELQDDPDRDEVEEMRANSSAAAFLASEKRRVKEIEKIVKTLPIWHEWAAGVRGLGAPGLGYIIGEAGDIGSYRSEAALWKRMGLAVLDGVAQGKLGKQASKEDWVAHGYNRKRRSVMFTIGDAMVKNGEKFRDIYLWRKEVERQKAVARGLIVKPSAKIKEAEKDFCMSDGHVHRRAQRYMEKKLLRAIYRQWLRTMVDRPVSAYVADDALAEAMTARRAA